MRDFARVLELQRHWSDANTPAMEERGHLIRHNIPNWFESFRDDLSSAIQPFGADLTFEGRDGTGRKTQIPWVRYGSLSHSPTATEGWYCVYLFEASGSRVYLALLHGATRWENGEFRPRSDEELHLLVSWAREQLGPQVATSMDKTIELGGTSPLARSYEKATVACFRYDADALPPENSVGI